MNPVKVAILGASGYTAFELADRLLRHPRAEIVAVTSRQDDQPRLDALHPALAGRTDLQCVQPDPEFIAERAEYAFLALPHTASLAAVPELRARGVRVIDLSADYRLKSAAVYADWYAHPHTDPEGLREAVYGLPEIFRDRIPPATLVANPGCYTSASILALAPLVAESRIDRSSIVIDAKSGVSGAGRSPKLATHYPECNESISAYNVGRHRHTPEIDQVLTQIGVEAGDPEPVEVLFTPHLVPMNRGILATIYANPRGTPAEHDLRDLYREYYRDSPFVRVVNHLPATKDTAHTNFVDIAVRVVKGRILILASLDNLVKGAAGVAIQNFNLMNALPETEGLL